MKNSVNSRRHFLAAFLLLCAATGAAPAYGQFWRTDGNTASSADWLGTRNNQPLLIKTNSTDRMIVLPTGQVGIGTNAPALKLDVAGDVGVTGDIQGKESAGFLGIYANTNNTNGAYMRAYGQDWGGGLTFNAGLNGSTGTNGLVRFVRWNGSTWNESMTLDGEGKLGLNMNGTLPSRTFDMTGNARITTLAMGFPALTINAGPEAGLVLNTTHPVGSYGYGIQVTADQPTTKTLSAFHGAIENFRVYANGNTFISGNVGIGKLEDPGYKLDVAGTIRACEVLVENNGWCDYVFEDNYDLRSIDELEAYVKENRHLPNIPAASVVESEGQSLGDYQKRMMEKIEELSLYVIELNGRVKSLEAENAELRAEGQK